MLCPLFWRGSDACQFRAFPGAVVVGISSGSTKTVYSAVYSACRLDQKIRGLAARTRWTTLLCISKFVAVKSESLAFFLMVSSFLHAAAAGGFGDILLGISLSSQRGGTTNCPTRVVVVISMSFFSSFLFASSSSSVFFPTIRSFQSSLFSCRRPSRSTMIQSR